MGARVRKVTALTGVNAVEVENRNGSDHKRDKIYRVGSNRKLDNPYATDRKDTGATNTSTGNLLRKNHSQMGPTAI